MVETFKSTKVKLADYDVMQTLGTGLLKYQKNNNIFLIFRFVWKGKTYKT